MKYAVIVGINKYRDGNNLLGCCTDADNVFLHLLENGYNIADITVLKDKNATKQAIVDALNAAVAELDEGDDMFFHFSGHGSQVADVSGDEADKKDEILCPHDMDWSGTYITDDELFDIFSNVPRNSYVEVILDCCHSGTATRQFSTARNIPSGLPSKFPVKKQVKDAFKGVLGTAVVWAGCADGQTSADAFIAGTWQGAFTHYWLKTVKKYPKLSRAEILKEARYQIMAYNFTQVPQLEIVCGGMG